MPWKTEWDLAGKKSMNCDTAVTSQWQKVKQERIAKRKEERTEKGGRRGFQQNGRQYGPAKADLWREDAR
jgi:hypothetical protein